MAVGDAAWDEAVGLLWSQAPGEQRRIHRVRESSWYACGLLMRDSAGDRARAIRIIENVLAAQFAAPGQRWDGTYGRAPEEPPPGPGRDGLWRNYDPNWRLFIGTTFVLILEQHAERLPADLRARMLDSIRRAVEGEINQGRDEAYHTNIALMYGFALGWAGRHLDRPGWVALGEERIEQVRAGFAVHGAFEEYNSPTYYGVDFYGLALCRRYGATGKIRAAGAEMEAGLWRDIARFYHAGLKNLCGPYDRAYGLDMRRYASLTGLWMGLALPAELTPFPAAGQPMGHAHDFAAAPLYVALGVAVPADVLPAFHTFAGERTLERPIEPGRTATAWLSERLMLGGELTSRTRGAGPGSRYGQFFPATAHWRIGTDEVGVFALVQAPPVDARATPGRLEIECASGELRFRFSVPGLVPAQLTRDRWQLPGLNVQLETDAASAEVEMHAEVVEIVYRAATRFRLSCALAP